jgi:hypothetical protein
VGTGAGAFDIAAAGGAAGFGVEWQAAPTRAAAAITGQIFDNVMGELLL